MASMIKSDDTFVTLKRDFTRDFTLRRSESSSDFWTAPFPPRNLAEFTSGDVGIGIPLCLIALNII